MHPLTIKDLENLSGIKAHTIRIWEQRYGFLKPKRTETNIRSYCCEELQSLLNIALLNKHGFKISQIDRMNPEEIKEKVGELNHPEARKEIVVNDLIQAMSTYDMEGFERIMDRYAEQQGMDKMITDLVFSFLERTGILWQESRIYPAQEHLVTHLIRQKLVVAIETTTTPLANGKTFLLFLPEGEHHELGLLYIYYLLKAAGRQTIYLGPNVPLDDVAYVIPVKKVSTCVLHFAKTGSQFNIDRFLKQAAVKLGKTEIIISGRFTHGYKKNKPDHIQFKNTLGELRTYLGGI